MLNALTAALVTLAIAAVPAIEDVERGYDPPIHYGVDLAVDDHAVKAFWGGTVSFSGTVVDFESVTIDLGGGVKHYYSFLASADIATSSSVEVGDRIGTSGQDKHFVDMQGGFHFSVRVDGRYVDPMTMWRIGESPHRGLRLVSPPLAERHNLA